MDTSALLTVAEVSVAFAGFASLITVLAKQNDSEWSEGNVVRFYTMIFNSLFSTLFALIPFAFLAFDLQPMTAWKYSGAILAGYLTLGTIWAIPQSSRLVKSGELSIYAIIFTHTLIVACLLVQFLALFGVLLPSFGTYFIGVITLLILAATSFVRLIIKVVTPNGVGDA